PDGLVTYEDAAARGAPRQPKAHEQSRRQRAVGIRERRPHADGAGRGIELVVHEVDASLTRKAVVAGEGEPDEARPILPPESGPVARLRGIRPGVGRETRPPGLPEREERR